MWKDKPKLTSTFKISVFIKLIKKITLLDKENIKVAGIYTPSVILRGIEKLDGQENGYLLLW